MSSCIDPKFHADVAANGTAIEDERRALARKLQYASPCGLEVADVVLAFTFRLNAGNVARHTLERLDSFIDAVAGKRITYKELTA